MLRGLPGGCNMALAGGWGILDLQPQCHRQTDRDVVSAWHCVRWGSACPDPVACHCGAVRRLWYHCRGFCCADMCIFPVPCTQHVSVWGGGGWSATWRCIATGIAHVSDLPSGDFASHTLEQSGTSGLVGHRRAQSPSALVCGPPLVHACDGPECLRGAGVGLRRGVRDGRMEGSIAASDGGTRGGGTSEGHRRGCRACLLCGGLPFGLGASARCVDLAHAPPGGGGGVWGTWGGRGRGAAWDWGGGA